MLGHVDTGKTKILDNIRKTNVQDKEAGGITQQIGATYFPMTNIQKKCEKLNKEFKLNMDKIPGLLVVDTPGHESFTNLRSRGSSLCDIAILVVDIMHGLEPQTIESLNLLRKRRTPFVVALNKIDRCYGWEAHKDMPFRETLAKQKKHTIQEFQERLSKAIVLFAEQGLNARVYYENDDFANQISLVPTSAITGEGIPDLLLLVVQLAQKFMVKKLMYHTGFQCTCLEVKAVDGLGMTIDVVLVNGELKDTDTIVVCGQNGPIVTPIRALLTPRPMKEIRVKGEYVSHKYIKAAQGIKICAPDLDGAVAGTSVYCVGPHDSVDELKDLVMEDLNNLMNAVKTVDRGVFVQASTLGALEALMEFLKTDAKIPVAGVNIGPVHKRDVTRASIQLEHNKAHACILAFDVPVSKDVQAYADTSGVRIFTADIIYHLQEMFTKYLDDIRAQRKEDTQDDAIFPVMLQIRKGCIFNKAKPIVMGCDVIEGVLKVGTPVAVVKDGIGLLDIGRVASIEHNHEEVTEAKKGEGVAIKLTPPGDNPNIMAGRHFTEDDMVYSHITRSTTRFWKPQAKQT